MHAAARKPPVPLDEDALPPVVPLPPGTRAAPGALADLLERLGALLLQYGCPTYRLERAIGLAAEAHGYRADVLGVPTGLWIHLRAGDEHLVRLVRVHAWSVDLGRLGELDAVFNRVVDGAFGVPEAHAALDRISTRPARYGRALTTLGGGLASAAAAIFFGGPLWVAAFGGLLGVVLVTLIGAVGRRPRTRLLADFISGLLAGGATWLATTLQPGLPRKPLILAGIIVMVPGLTLTAGLRELAQKNLVSGTARLMEAGMTMLSLVFGVAVVATIERALDPQAVTAIADGPPVLLPLWGLGLTALIAASSFTLLFQIPPREAPYAILSGMLAWSAAGSAERLVLTGPAAAFIGALAVGVFANAMARLRDRPAQTYLLPGIVLLVPGAFGFISFDRVLSGDAAAGAAGFVMTFLIAAALVIGLLLASAILPPRKVL